MVEYISKSEVIAALKEEYREEWAVLNKLMEVKRDCSNRINDMPATDVRENVKGEWIFRGHLAQGVNLWECSICKKQMFSWGKQRDKFCSNCGADMREEEMEAQ